MNIHVINNWTYQTRLMINCWWFISFVDNSIRAMSSCCLVTGLFNHCGIYPRPDRSHGTDRGIAALHWTHHYSTDHFSAWYIRGGPHTGFLCTKLGNRNSVGIKIITKSESFKFLKWRKTIIYTFSLWLC